MKNGIIIIGSGFAARWLVKNIRNLDSNVPLTLIAADSMDEYNKPDLSHVISQAKRANDMTRQTAGQFAEQFNLALYPHTHVTAIDASAQVVHSADREWHYDRLVLATGAKTFVPPIPGNELMFTLNSQQEYRACETSLRDAKRVLIVGAGLIGCELAMDFNRAGKAVTLVDNTATILATLMPAQVSSKLQHRLVDTGVHLMMKSHLSGLEKNATGIRAVFDRERVIEVDAVVAATGLRPDIKLAKAAGLAVNRGIVVNSGLQTSDPAIYAVGDCAEINGQLLPFLQPIQISAMTAAKNLSGDKAELKLPAMLVKVKTPELPLHLAGETQRADLNWIITHGEKGMIAKGTNAAGELRAFVVSEDEMKQAFALLRDLKLN